MTWIKKNWIPLLCLLGIFYIIFYQHVFIRTKLQKCHDIAVNIEKARHYPVDDLTVTNQDISG